MANKSYKEGKDGRRRGGRVFERQMSSDLSTGRDYLTTEVDEQVHAGMHEH